MSKPLLKDLAAYAPVTVVPPIVGVIFIPVVTRLFPDPAAYGVYSLLTTSIAFGLALTAWLRTATIRFHARFADAGQEAGFQRGTLAYLASTVGLIVVPAAAFSPFLRHALPGCSVLLILLACTTFALRALLEQLLVVLRVQHRARAFVLISATYATVPLIAGVPIVLAFDTGVEGLFYGRVLALALLLPLLWRLCLGGLALARARIPPGLFRKLATYGVPMVISSLAGLLLRLSDRYMLASLQDMDAVGLYSVSYGIAERCIGVLVSLFLLADRPIAMRLWEGTPEAERPAKVEAFLQQTTRYFLLLAVPAALGLWALDKPLLQVLTSAKYVEAYKVMPYVAFSLVLSGVANRFQLPILFHERTGLILANTAVAAALNIGLNLFMIPLYGYKGAAVTTLIGYVAYLAGTLVYSRRCLRWRFPHASLWRITVAAVLMFATLRLGFACGELSPALQLATGIPGGAGIFALVLFLLRELRMDDLRKLRRRAPAPP